ncbi:hypothetical protein [Streptomyces sp. NBC_01601]|uniref:hypothetical protein n=1 Tax=Streptomyces sp. NBC_01601 TaxID=2975892 RepID=UPI002E2D9635|nr:hypothetical protein [Streptomyces sp. NBC_01601]
MTEPTTTIGATAAVTTVTKGAPTGPSVWILESGEECEGGSIVGVYAEPLLAADDILDLLLDRALHAKLDLDEFAEDPDAKRLYVSNGTDWISLTRHPVTTRRRLAG